jgi:hypothetical protein
VVERCSALTLLTVHAPDENPPVLVPLGGGVRAMMDA